MAPTKKSTLAALAVLSLSSLAAASDVVVDDAPIVADAPAAVAAADAAPKKLTTAEKIAAVTPKTPWTPSTVKLPAGTLADQFPSVADFESNWVPSRSQKADVPAGSADNDKDQDLWRYRGEWKAEEPHTTKGSGPGDLGLVVSSPAAHHAISRKLPKPVEFKGKSTVTIQYEVKLQNGLECGGAYMKLLEKDAAFVPAQFSDKSPYTIMFGPDKCGGTNKVHFIYRHKNAKTGVVHEHHLKNPPSVPSTFSKETHLYTLLVHPESNTYEIKIDNESKQKGSLFDDFTPAVVAPKEIDDASDSKPTDWVDEAKIVDPAATKPADWDEDAPAEIEDLDAKKPAGWLDDAPDYVPDPDAVKPEDWEDEEDGEWTAPSVPNPKCAEAPGCGEWKRPMIKNPAYKGKWSAPMIDNPTYKGPWAPRKVPNPEYYDEKHPGHMTPIGAIGLELWTMQDQIMFDNILISDSVTAEQLEAWTKDTWTKKHDVELAVIKAEEPETDVTDADKDAGAALSLAEQFAPANLQKFVDTLVVDPKKALDKYPAPLAAIALFVTMLVAALGSFVFGGSSAAKPAVATKKAARSASPKKKSDDEEEEKKPAAAKASGSKKSADGESARKRAKAAEKEASVADAEDDDE